MFLCWVRNQGFPVEKITEYYQVRNPKSKLVTLRRSSFISAIMKSSWSCRKQILELVLFIILIVCLIVRLTFFIRMHLRFISNWFSRLCNSCIVRPEICSSITFLQKSQDIFFGSFNKIWTRIPNRNMKTEVQVQPYFDRQYLKMFSELNFY